MSKLQYAIVSILTLSVLLLGACGPAAPSAVTPAASGQTPPNITVKALDFSFDAPDQIQSGLVSMTLENDGKEPHQAQLVRLNDNVTMDQLMATLQKSPDAVLQVVSTAGGPNVIGPSQTQQVTMNLAPGNYAYLCFVSGQDNVPHLAKGMIKPFTVTSAPGSAAGAPPQVAEPTTNNFATLQDFTIHVPVDPKAGPQVWKVSNVGPQPHDLGLFKLAEGKTAEDFMKFMQDPQAQGQPPFEEAGGLGAIASNSVAWMSLDLKPGTYIAVCFVPDPQTGKSHAELGMVMPFTVK